MNEYERKQAQRRERLEAAAGRARARASAAHAGARRIMDGIPLGQPILVGHHSERRHRRDIARIDTGMRRAHEESDRAAELAHAAQAVGSGGVSSDDPDALAKLRAQLADLESARDSEKRWNAEVRKIAKRERSSLGRDLTQSDHERIVMSSSMPEDIKARLASYARAFAWLPQFGTNTAANVRRIESRIRELEQRATTPERASVSGATPDGVAWILRDNKGANRTQILFTGQPEKPVREALKARGFRWAPSEGAWQRQLSNGAWYAATQALGYVPPSSSCDCAPSSRPCRACEADPREYPCPDGASCSEPDCVQQRATSTEGMTVTTYKIKHSHGQTETGIDSYEDAVARVQSVYGADVEIGHSGDIEDFGERTLCWSTTIPEADRDGSRACCSIVKAAE